MCQKKAEERGASPRIPTKRTNVQEEKRMKLSRLGALIKEQNGAHVLNTMDAEGNIVRQHLMLYGAMYPMDGFPLLTKETLLTILDVPRDKWTEYWYKEENHTDLTRLMAEDNPSANRDTPASLCGVRLETPLADVTPVTTYHGMLFIPSDYKKPISDEKAVEWWARKMPAGYLVVAKKGYQLIASIAAVKVWATEDTATELMDIANAARRLCEQQKAQEQQYEQQRL